MTSLQRKNKAFTIKRFCDWRVGKVKKARFCNAKYRSLKEEHRAKTSF